MDRRRRSCPTRSRLATELRTGRLLRAAAGLVAALLLGGAPLGCAGAQGSASAAATSGTLRLRQLDVGQGDAALITTPEGRRVLIDAGPSATDVADLLAREGIDTLDLVIASHNHADHIGGMPEVLRRFVVRAYVENGLPHTTSIYARTLAALEREPGLQYLAASDRTITLGSVSMRILPPPRQDQSQNNNSVGVLVEFGRFRALYTGDSEAAELRAWLQGGRVPRVTLVKLAHHGSSTGTKAEWVRATAPAVAVVSLGSRNAYGHPSPGVEAAWSAIGARVYRTDRQGTIEVEALRDGRFTVSASRRGRVGVR